MLRLSAPAKVNLTLEVLARRGDGYHGVRSLMVPIARYDAIEIEAAAQGSFTSDDARVGLPNSVLAALDALGYGPARVHLVKNIPIGAGLGGGSSDAAAVLEAAMRGRLGAPLAHEPRDWIATARALGSDVPFFLVGTGALVEGTGERVTAVGALPPWWVLVAHPAVEVPTTDAYRLLDVERMNLAAATRPRSGSVSLAALEALQRGDFDAIVAALVNDFEPVVLRAFPPVAAAHAALAAAAETRALLSGSGSCSFALFRSEAQARNALGRLEPASAAGFVAPFAAADDWR